LLALLLIALGQSVFVSAQEATDSEVYVGFNTGYSYNMSGDNFTNGEVIGQKDWNTNLDRKDAASPVTNVNLTLATGLVFDYIYPDPTTMGPPIGWSFGDVAPESGVGVGLGPGSPVSFSPGFNASRVADNTVFTASGNQTLTITVTPQQVLPNLGIDVEVWDDENVSATIISPTTDENQGIWLWEGKKLHIQIENPVEPSYTYEVIIEVTPNFPEIEFMPNVSIGRGEEIASGTESSSFPYTITELGTWTWSADGSYAWQWWESIYRVVHFEGYSKKIEEPIPHVPMTGNKLFGQGVYGSMPGSGDAVISVFSFTNPDCVRAITVEQISIFRMDGTVAYEGPLLFGQSATMNRHETRNIELNAYVSPQEPPTFYTVEIFWSEADKGLPLTGWVYTITFTQDGQIMELKSISQTIMVNMIQTSEPVKKDDKQK
jgi:hypothetical protein